jgi:hypothetical protein
VLKLTTDGAYTWVSTFRGVSSDFDLSRTLSVALDGNGGLFVGGTYVGTVDFDPGPGTTTLPTSSGFNGFVTKLTTAAGSLVWARPVGGATGSDTMVWGLAADAAGNVYATGFFQGTTDFDPGADSWLATSAGGSDAYVVKLTAGGSFGWATTFGGAGSDTSQGVAVDPAGTVHLAGGYQGTVDFDPDPVGTFELTSPGTYYSSFLVRLRQS